MANQQEIRRRRLPWYGWMGLITLLAGEAGLFQGVFPVQVLFYCIAWWSYILIVDAWVWKRRGHSLLRNRPWEFCVLAFWSMAIWNLFEVLNFRLQNWFYVNVPTDFIYGATFALFAYATVVPGLFETYDLLRAYGIADRVRMRPWCIRPSGIALAIALGGLMLLAPLLWPRYAFPWVWGFAVFLFDPLCFRADISRERSLLGRFERGDPRPFLRLLLAGLICGAFWEFWNFWAYTKWVYTVPLFEDLKWFEMPPLGFLGFPPFALECYVLINFLNRLRRGRGWEEPGQEGPGAPRGLATASVIIACVFNLGVYAGIDRFTVQSYSPILAEMEGLPGSLLARLSRVGVTSPHALLKQTATPAQREALSRLSGIAQGDLQMLRTAAQLVELKGLGAAHYNELRRLGITRVEELASQEPEDLVLRWQAVAGRRPPTLAQVGVWIRAARQHRHASGNPGPPAVILLRRDGQSNAADELVVRGQDIHRP